MKLNASTNARALDIARRSQDPNYKINHRIRRFMTAYLHKLRQKTSKKGVK